MLVFIMLHEVLRMLYFVGELSWLVRRVSRFALNPASLIWSPNSRICRRSSSCVSVIRRKIAPLMGTGGG